MTLAEQTSFVIVLIDSLHFSISKLESKALKHFLNLNINLN